MLRKILFLSSVFCLLISSVWAQAPAGAPARAPQMGASSIHSPVVSDDGRVTIRFRAPNAKEVILNLLGRHPMQKDDQGIWSFTTDPLPPDYYPYSIIVDGMNLADSSNPLSSPRLQSAPGSLVHVPGPASLSWELNENVPHGTISHNWYKSTIIGDTRDFYVYTPAGYDPSGKTKYPVLFLLHGLTEEAAAWMTVGRANVILDNLIAQGKAKPMIVVSTLGYGLPLRDLVDRSAMSGPRSKANFSKAVIEEVLPTVEKTYHVSKNSNMHAIAGLSMGGATTFYIGLNHPDQFAWVAGLSSALVEYNIGEPEVKGSPAPITDVLFAKIFPSLEAKINSRLRLLWVACGTDDGLLGVNRQFKDWLKGKNIQFSSIETPGAHTWMVWRRNLTELAPLLFQTKK
jgi:enterochelin esterase-like enzyme